uniref:Glutamyl-tRNA(Gln) amidotransferase subunit A n=1 Tax=Coccidioides posadasii RMSCC 3488 TaxID=454284 RepID=A0A0J6FTB2_COCPO|nr:glutamyl-tRNA(Gln) amidotransferase subunit A [Coccidioides posadasii RMSCC 3488]
MAVEAKLPPSYQYPTPIEGPNVPYKNEGASNPVLRGRLLQIGASLVQSSNFIQSILWKNAGFSVLHTIKELEDYEPRYDPTVFPSTNYTAQTVPSSAVPRSAKRQGGYYTAADYRALYLSGELTPIAVVDALLPLIRRDVSPAGEHSIAFLQSKVDLIRAAAEASTARYKNGTSLGPMDGVPVAVKDEVDIDGYKRTVGTKLDYTNKSGGTSWCVKKWEEAGAIVIGKTTMHELGLDTSNNNPNFGTPRNPHNPNYYTGGSSGGSGYAVGAGIVPIALGADGGGSIRIPSSFCGIYGLKTTHGRVSGSPTRGLATTTGVFGPMTSSLDDLDMSYRIMSSPDPDHVTSSSFPDPASATAATARPKIIGVYQEWVKRSDPAVLSLFNRAMDYYRTQQNYEIIDITIPYIPQGQKAHALTILSEIASGISKEEISQLSAPNRVLVSSGNSQVSARDFFAAQKLRSLLMSHLAFLFKKYPGMVIATPTLPIAGWQISPGGADLTHGVSDVNTSLRTMEYVYLANFSGCPAISCPMGYAEDSKLPVGIMGMSEWGSEWALIEWGRDGEGMLDTDEDVSVDSNGTANGGEAAVVVSKGLRTPSVQSGGKWVDAIGLAKNNNVGGNP